MEYGANINQSWIKPVSFISGTNKLLQKGKKNKVILFNPKKIWRSIM